MNNNYSLRESPDYFGCLEGRLYSPLFGCELPFLAKGCDEVYAERCAEYFESVRADNLSEHAAFSATLKALVKYVADLLDDHRGEFDIGDVVFDEYSSVGDLLKIISPSSLTFERFGYLSDEECPVAFSLKLIFAPVPDEVMEIALHGNEPVYAGELRGVNPWNDKLLKKKYNYLGR